MDQWRAFWCLDVIQKAKLADLKHEMKNSIPAIFSLPSTYIQAFHRFQTDMRIFRLPPSAARCETTAGSSDFGEFDATSVPVALGCNPSIWTRKAALKERHGEKHQYPLNIIKYHNLNYIIWYQYHSISNISIFNPLEYQGGFPVGPFVSNMYQFWPMVSFWLLWPFSRIRSDS